MEIIRDYWPDLEIKNEQRQENQQQSKRNDNNKEQQRKVRAKQGEIWRSLPRGGGGGVWN